MNLPIIYLTPAMFAVAAAAAATALLLATTIWVHVRQRAAVNRLDERTAHLMACVSLLTDATESSLREVAVEIGRLATVTEGARARGGPAGHRSMADAVRQGHSLQTIAAREDVSEGEVRLHVQLDQARKERAHHATLR
jgi:hypothetical protein